jgi:hypothetical protein
MSEIPNASELLEQTANPELKSAFRIGTVTELFTTPLFTAKIKFDGEEVASEKQYSYLASYSPIVNDRVIMATIAGTYIILGNIAYNTAPANINRSLNVTTLVGFFGTTPRSKSSVSDPSSISTTETADTTYSSNEVTMLGHLKTDVTNLQSKLTSLINALQGYGLV